MSNPIRVLVVEDSEAHSDLILRALRGGGFAPVHERVSSVAAVEEALTRGPWDVVICGSPLSSTSVSDVLRTVRGWGADLPLIVVSGTPGEDLAVAAIRAGANDYLIQDRLAGLPASVERELRDAENRRARLFAEEQLVLSQEQLRSLVESLDDYVFTIDRECRHVALLGRGLKSVALHPAEVVGLRITEIVGEQEGAAIEAEYRQALAGKSVTYEWSRIVQGRRVYVQTSLSPLRAPTGEVVGAAGVGRDVTRPKLSERRLATQYEASSILAGAGGLDDVAPRLLEVICGLLEWDYAELWLPAAGSTDLLCAHRARRQGGSTDAFEESVRSLRFRSGEGVPGLVFARREAHWCEDVRVSDEFVRRAEAAAAGLASLCAVPVAGDAGVAGVLLVFSREPLARDEGMIDIVASVGRHLAQFMERRHAEAQVRSRDEQLRQSQRMEAIGQLAGGVAHDFNNLLTAIIGYSDQALRRLPREDPAWREVNEVKRAGERAAALTRQLLAFSRKQILQPAVIDLNDVVRELERLLRRVIGEHIDLAVLPADGLWRVRADPSQLEQVIMNLAVNARDALPEGGRITIETENVTLDEAYARTHLAAEPGRYVMLAVSDNGHGMDETTKARVFEPFFTTKAKGRGTGLGLSTVYGIVRQSGGHIWVYSEPGKGTTFKVYLPQFGGEAASAPLPVEPAGPPRGSETVLLAEDEALVRDLLATMLRELGYDVLVASSAEQALAVSAAREGAIHVLVTDVVMPGLSGRQLYERLAAARPEMRVLYISGYTDNAIVHHGVLDEGTPFLQKPFGPDVLARKLREVLAPRG